MSNKESRETPRQARIILKLQPGEQAALDKLRSRAIGLGMHVTKSQMVRAALSMLASADEATLKAALTRKSQN